MANEDGTGDTEVERVRVTEVVLDPVFTGVIDRVSVTETVSDGDFVRVAPVLDPVKDATEYVRERVFDWDRVIGETDTDTENDIGEEEALTVSVAGVTDDQGVTVGPGEAVRTLGLDVGDTVCDTILDPDGDGDTETTGVIDPVGPRDIEDTGL